MIEYQDSALFVRKMDHEDPLSEYRNQFHIPQKKGKPVIYLCGNSLGLQPRSVTAYVEEELHAWQQLGVEGHFEGKNPWADYHWFLKKQLAELTGSLESEVVAMNNLTTNLHLMMVSFYRPVPDRYKILIEAGAFPSDQYAVESQARFHGFNPDDAILELKPEGNQEFLATDHILSVIERHAEELALILLPGVQYYTGQYFDIEKITRKGHEKGIMVGWDLAHAVGNLPLSLHEWDVDFATWCSYKYLNSGPGGISGIFVNERYANDTSLPRFAGWWGHQEEERFKMKKGFIPMTGADGWQLSNKNILSLAAQRASLALFMEAGMIQLRNKSLKLTGFMEYLIRKRLEGRVNIITPSDPAQRGCQLSLVVPGGGREIFEHLTGRGVVMDWREPAVIRVAPVPLYNTFYEVYSFVELLESCLEEVG